MESAVSFAPLRPAGFDNFIGWGGAICLFFFSRGGLRWVGAGQACLQNILQLCGKVIARLRGDKRAEERTFRPEETKSARTIRCQPNQDRIYAGGNFLGIIFHKFFTV